MDQTRLQERLMTAFLSELDEHARTLNGDLLALEKGLEGPERAERFKGLFRAAHSLKGAARAVNVSLIEEACHRLEEILGAARSGSLLLSAELFALLFEAVDAIEETGVRLREQNDLSNSPLAALLPRLEAAEEVPAETTPSQPIVVPSARDVAMGSAGAEAQAVLAAQARPPEMVASAPEPSVPASRVPSSSPAVEGRSERSREGALGESSVRVPAEKLDWLLSRNGELLVARRRVEVHAQRLMELREHVGRWREEWRADTKPLMKLLASSAHARETALPGRTIDALGRVGEELRQLEKDIDRFAVTMTSDHRQFARAASLLDDEVRRVRMLPFAQSCQGLDRIVRDLALAVGKHVELVVEGGDVELDRSVLEGLKDPLIQLVRNAVDHGVETPDRRRAAGKPATARVTVSASLRGTLVEVVVADDGAGIDRDGLRRQAAKRGHDAPAADRDLIDMIFLPGFSTAPLITNISGRGVGLDVVKSRVEGLHGTIGTVSEPGQGTRFTLSVPLTLTTLRVLLVRASGQSFALASAHVWKLVRVDPRDLRPIKGREMWVRDGSPLPVALLSDVLGLAAGEPPPRDAKLPGLIMVTGDRRMLFVVDELIAEQEIIIKGMGHRFRRLRFFSGATILPDGDVALVLNAPGLLHAALGRNSGLTTSRPAHSLALTRKRLLVVDDSLTTRTLEKSILEAAGYEVAVAVDGEAGWKALQEQGADLLVSDIEMPRMDGFALTETVRRSERFGELPVILLSSRASDVDKARGIEVGANAYIVKGAFEQTELLATIAQLL